MPNKCLHFFPTLTGTNELLSSIGGNFLNAHFIKCVDSTSEVSRGRRGVNIYTRIHQMDVVTWTFPLRKTNKTACLEYQREQSTLFLWANKLLLLLLLGERCDWLLQPVRQGSKPSYSSGLKCWTCKHHLQPLTIGRHLQTALLPQHLTMMGLQATGFGA